jgi:hypothetical protein
VARGQQIGSIAVTIGMSEFDAISRLSEEFAVARVPNDPGLLVIRSKRFQEESVGAVSIRNGRVTSVTADWTPMTDRSSALADVLFSLLSRFTTRKQAGWRSASACSIAATDPPTAAADAPVRMLEIACDRQTVRLSMTRLTGGGSHVEVALVVLVWTVGHWLWRSQIALGRDSWYAMLEGTRWHLTPAGYWYAFVSIPMFQFILLRWYLRLLIWFRFLWQVSRLNLHFIPTHPDRAAGLGFLGKSSYAFGPILFAQGAMLSGVIASRVLFGGASLLSFKMEAVGLIGVFLLFILGPLTMFSPQLARAKRKGLADYGLLASRYVERFEKKWVGNESQYDELLGTGDIQSLADLANSYEVVRGIRPVPFGRDTILQVAVPALIPFAPLALTVVPAEEILKKLLGMLL